MAIAANKVRGVRCGIAYNDETAALIRQHNDANMVAFGARFMTDEEIERRTDIFLNTNFLQSYHSTHYSLYCCHGSATSSYVSRQPFDPKHNSMHYIVSSL